MKNKLFLILMTFCTFVLLTSATKAEARHCKSRSSFGISLGSSCVRQDPVVVRRYVTQPAQVVYAAPVLTPTYYQPVYYQPAYPVVIAPSPIYMEEVYVVPRAPRVSSGLSFSWNFFR